MAKFIVLTLLLAGSAWPEVRLPDVFDEAWHVACDISDYSCEGVDQPSVQLMWHHAWRGGYDGDGVVHINLYYPKDRIEFMATLVHEYLHHIHYVQGDISYESQKDICDSEDHSYTRVNAWLATIKRPDLQIHNWWESQEGHRGYWKCLPWYPGIPDFVIGEPSFELGDEK